MDITAQQLILSCIVFAAFFTESVVGFGSTILTVTLGAHLLPLEVLLPAVVPLNLVLSGTLVARAPQQVDGALLRRQILPSVAVGMACGMVIFRYAQPSALMLAFGVFVLLLSGRELFKLVYGAATSQETVSLGRARGVLWAGGVVHGMFGSGGPLIVYVMGRLIGDKHIFRSTLAALWLILNSVLVLSYLQSGVLGMQTLKLTLACVPALMLGMWLGELVHHRISASAFRVLTWALLCAAALARVVSELVSFV